MHHCTGRYIKGTLGHAQSSKKAINKNSSPSYGSILGFVVGKMEEGGDGMYRE